MSEYSIVCVCVNNLVTIGKTRSDTSYQEHKRCPLSVLIVCVYVCVHVLVCRTSACYYLRIIVSVKVESHPVPAVRGAARGWRLGRSDSLHDGPVASLKRSYASGAYVLYR